MKVSDLAVVQALISKRILEAKEGKQGNPGEKGDQGPVGPVGATGADGKVGEVGKAGKDGNPGPQGPQGRTGAKGAKGPKGDAGQRGPKGIAGPVGKRGETGVQGPKGEPGQAGASGRSVKAIKVNNENMLVVTYDDGDVDIAGKVSVTKKTEVFQNGQGLPPEHFAIHSIRMDDEDQLVVKANNNKTFVVPMLKAADIGGFADYNDTSTASTPVTLADDVWTDLPNNGEGAFTNLKLPSGVTRMLDPTTGSILLDELPIGSSVIIRMDYTVFPTSNNASLSFRYELGNGSNSYTLETTVSKLDDGAGKGYRQALVTHYIYVGDSNTKDNPVQPQVKLSGGGTLTNAGMVMEIRKAAEGYFT